jgi:TRAP-type C4-dicarboxylate transport system permease small subunit
MKSIEKTLFWKSITKLQGAIVKITSLGIMAIVVFNVFARYVFRIELFGFEEMVVIIAMWMYWIGGVYATYENSHIKGDMIDLFTKSKKKKKIVSYVAQSLTIFGLALFAWWGIEWTQWNLQLGQRTPGLRWPMIWSQIPVAISFVMMFLYSVYHLIRTIFPIKPEDEPAKEVTE